ncbi:MAG: hypothetical protein J2P46_21655 [Zavarzinella sp.]|nr:hypothetical protein [Zavarzinella sp.]
MQATEVFSAAEGRIWDRVLRPAARTLSVAAARSILRLEFAPEDRERMRELAAKAREDLLTANDWEEIRDYERVGNLMALLKSKARLRLSWKSTRAGASSCAKR